MIGNIINPLVAAEIGGAFGEASGHVRERLARATRREGEGQAATREDTFTDHIVDAFEQSVREQLERSFQQLDSAGVSVEFEATKAIQGEENQFGLDLGVRILIETPTYAIEKAILVQCKRMYGVGAAGTFPKLRGDGEEQAAKMLKVTPAAFFFLYCAGEGDELIELMQPATSAASPRRLPAPKRPITEITSTACRGAAQPDGVSMTYPRITRH